MLVAPELREMQKKYPVMADVRGVGLMTAVEFCKPGTFEPDAQALHDIQAYLLKEEHVLTTGCGVNHNGFRFITPLSVTKDELDMILAKFEKAVASYKA